MAINHRPVQSSMIQSIGHDPDNDIIEVKFNNGKKYQYAGTESDYEEFCNANSCGKHFNEFFKGKER